MRAGLSSISVRHQLNNQINRSHWKHNQIMSPSLPIRFEGLSKKSWLARLALAFGFTPSLFLGPNSTTPAPSITHSFPKTYSQQQLTPLGSVSVVDFKLRPRSSHDVPYRLSYQSEQAEFNGQVREFTEPEDLAAFKDIGNHPKLHEAARKLAYFAMDWKLNQSTNPHANKSSPSYRAGSVAYKLLASARSMDTAVIELKDKEGGTIGLNYGDGSLIEITPDGDDDWTARTFIHELVHNRYINGVDLGEGYSKEEEAACDYLADLVVSGMDGYYGRSWAAWHKYARQHPYNKDYLESQPGFMGNLETALGIDINENGFLGR
jgi:hypothetical protein